MTTRKISDLPKPHDGWSHKKRMCISPYHLPPSHRVFEPGVYEHTCPMCGNVIVFTVSGFRCFINTNSVV